MLCLLAEASPNDTILAQFSGYGATPSHIARTLTILGTSAPLEAWDPSTVHSLVSSFVDVKFPTVLALNKVDHPDADANIMRIAKTHPKATVVLTSSIAEVFLRKLKRQGFVRYVEGSDIVETRDDLVEAGDELGGGLKEPDDRLKARIENLRDMVLFRFGGTGVDKALAQAGELLGLVPVFPVPNSHGLSARLGAGAEDTTATDGDPALPTNALASSAKGYMFRDCVLMPRGATVKDVARKVLGDAPLAYVEGPAGVRVGEGDVVVKGSRDVSSSP